MMTIFASLVLAAAAVAGDGEVWNEGVDFYRKGDVTNALRVLRPLMLSQTHGARAAEVVAKLSHEAGNLETAAAAAQIALRAAPDDPRANRNFTRAVDRLPAVREEKRLQKLIQSAQGQDPGAALLGAAHEARAVFEAAGTYRTNAAPKAVALADALAARAERLADVWVPVRQAICQSVTNEEQAATILAQLDAAAAKTRAAAEKLGDLDPEGYAAASDVESEFTRFAKLTAAPPAAIGEDLVAQSNAWLDAETVNGRAWQPEALDWTRAFRARFPAWARAYEQQAQSDTNKPPFKPEDQAKVSALATELEKLQLACVEKSLPPDQEKALGLIAEIQKLLPKDKNGGGQSQSSQQSQKDQKQDKQDQQQNKDQQPDQQPQDRQDQDPNEQQQDDPKDAEADEPEEKPDDREVQDVLKKAQERSDEHEADKKARMRKAPLPPNERDW